MFPVAQRLQASVSVTRMRTNDKLSVSLSSMR